MGGGDEPDGRAARGAGTFRAPKTPRGDPEPERRLDLERQIAHLVEQQGAAAHRLQKIGAAVRGPGKRAALTGDTPTPKFVGHEGAAGQGHEGACPTPAQPVERPRDQLLARPRLADDEDGHVKRRQAPDNNGFASLFDRVNNQIAPFSFGTQFSNRINCPSCDQLVANFAEFDFSRTCSSPAPLAAFS